MTTMNMTQPWSWWYNQRRWPEKQVNSEKHLICIAVILPELLARTTPASSLLAYECTDGGAGRGTEALTVTPAPHITSTVSDNKHRFYTASLSQKSRASSQLQLMMRVAHQNNLIQPSNALPNESITIYWPIQLTIWRKTKAGLRCSGWQSNLHQCKMFCHFTTSPPLLWTL